MIWPFKYKEIEPQPTTLDKLKLAKAELARLRELPDSDFTIVVFPPYSIQHGVDVKQEWIARKKAEIAYLEALVEPPNKRKEK